MTADIALVESVLHPTDFSGASERAFAHALAISLLRETDFTILHVDPKEQSDPDWTQFPRVRDTLERWGLLETGSPRSAVFDQLRVNVTKTVIKGRHVTLAVAGFLDRQPHDLVVLATEGLEASPGWIRNRSNAEAIANWSRTMTLFVPASATRGLISLENGNFDFRNVLVPVDVEPDCSAAVAFAARTADLLGDGGVAITLLHVGDPLPLSPDLPQLPELTWRSENRTGEPVAEILAAAASHQADLIVMATAGYDSVLDALRGSTTDQVVRRAPCPVLAVPAR